MEYPWNHTCNVDNLYLIFLHDGGEMIEWKKRFSYLAVSSGESVRLNRSTRKNNVLKKEEYKNPVSIYFYIYTEM